MSFCFSESPSLNHRWGGIEKDTCLPTLASTCTYVDVLYWHINVPTPHTNCTPPHPHSHSIYTHRDPVIWRNMDKIWKYCGKWNQPKNKKYCWTFIYVEYSNNKNSDSYIDTVQYWLPEAVEYGQWGDVAQRVQHWSYARWMYLNIQWGNIFQDQIKATTNITCISYFSY